MIAATLWPMRRGSLIRSFGHAFAGVAALLRTERNARVHAAAFAGVVAFGAWRGLERWEWAAVLAACFAVPAAEAMNTALEALADRVTTEDDPLIKRAKDLGAAAVLLTSLGAAAVGVCVFGPRLAALVFEVR